MEAFAPTSQVTFLYFDQVEEAQSFFSDLLGLPLIYDPGWAKVWRVNGPALVGAVERHHGSIETHSPAQADSVLVSFTLDALEPVRQILLADGRWHPSDVKEVPGIPLRSFFVKGPGGYSFEFQQFTDDTIRTLF